ncbi:MAG TPA: condensation domain-containing protein, partial [Thermoanaerobaculia bacterium]|nr:condensation domain-containing protein [Thermoanaerobaculia bacterium]
MMTANDTRLVSRLSADQLRLIARQLREQAGAGGASPLARQPRGDGRFPLSFAQERLWFLEQLEPGLISYNVAVKVCFQGRLDRGALRESLSRIAGRHEALRTSFRMVEGKPQQEIHAAAAVPVPLVDLSGLPAPRRGAEAEALALGAARTPFDLSAGDAGPLLRATLLQMAAAEHRLVLVLHHIVCDGWSAGILVREFALLYASLATAGEAALSELSVQYADYAVWQRQQSAGGTWKEPLAYWRDQLAGLPPLVLPTDRPRLPLQSGNGRRQRLAFQAGSAEAVREIGRRGQATPFMVLLSAFSVLLGRAAGQGDFGIATPVAGRVRPELQGLIGFFADTLVLRTVLADDPSFGDLLARTRETVTAAFAHQNVPFALLVQELAPDRALGTTPLAQVMFSLEELPAIPPFAGLTLDLEEVDNRTAKFDQLLALRFGADGLQGHLEYSTDLFEPATAARLAAQLEQILAALARDPAAPVRDLALLSATERHQLVTEWNDNAAGAAAAGTIPELLSAQAVRTPGAVAVIHGEARLTYGELHARARRLAEVLRQRGVGPEVRVGVCLERSADLVAALIAVLQAGGAYVPLDPAYPRERLGYILADSAASLVVTREALLARLPADGVPAICLDRDAWEGPETLAAGGEPAALPQ